jgi:hypothetical protein
VFVESDHAADTGTRRSMTGVVLRLGDVLCRWGAKRRHSVGLSTCEAEYYATTCGAQEDSLWVGHILAFFIGGRSSVDVHLIAASLSDGIRTGRLWSRQASSRMRPTQSEVLCARCHCVLLGSTSRETNRMVALYTPKDAPHRRVVRTTLPSTGGRWHRPHHPSRKTPLRRDSQRHTAPHGSKRRSRIVGCSGRRLICAMAELRVAANEKRLLPSRRKV